MNTKTTNSRIPRKARLLGLLAVAVSAISLVPATAGAATTKVNTQASLEATSFGLAGGGLLTGTVRVDSNQKLCTDRDITIEINAGVNPNNFTFIDTANLFFGGFQSVEPNGDYRFIVERKVGFSPKGKKIVCKPATSNVAGF